MLIREFRMRTIAFISLMAAAAFAGAPATAQELYSVSVKNYQPVPAGATYVTDMNDNTELTAAADQALRDGLDRRGLHYDSNAALGFKIGTNRDYSTPNAEASFDRRNSILNLMFNSGD